MSNLILTVAEDKTLVIEIGIPGPQGQPGQPGAAFSERMAAAPLSALRVVWEDAQGQAWPLDASDAAHIDRIAGLTLTAAGQAGQSVRIQRFGLVDVEGLSLTPGRVWLGADGALIQTPPVTGFDILVGYATAENRLYLCFYEPINLS